MNRIKISRSRPLVKYVAFFITLFCLYIIALYHRDGGTVLVASIIAIISFIAGYQAYYAATIEFDDENMYVSYKKINNEIPLKQIIAIKLSSNRVNQSHYWDIFYYDSFNNEQTLQILPKYKNFSLFREKVMEKNPDVQIKDSVFF